MQRNLLYFKKALSNGRARQSMWITVCVVMARLDSQAACSAQALPHRAGDLSKEVPEGQGSGMEKDVTPARSRSTSPGSLYLNAVSHCPQCVNEPSN